MHIALFLSGLQKVFLAVLPSGPKESEASVLACFFYPFQNIH